MKTRGKLIDIKLSFQSHRPVVSFEIIGEPEDIEKYIDMDLDISFDKHRGKRSLDANACLWACLGDIARKINTDNWSVYLYMLERYGKFTHVVIKPEAVEELKRQWREIKVVGDTLVNGEPMKQVLCFFGSSTYNSKEFSQLLDGVISDMKDLGLEPPMSDNIKAIIEEMERKEHARDLRP